MTAHRVTLPEWAVARGRALNRFDAVEPARTALVVIDMQRVFLAPDQVFGNPYALALTGRVNVLAQAMRDAGGTVIWTRQTVSDRPPLAMPEWQYDLSIPAVRRAVAAMAPDGEGHALHPAMRVAPQDVVLDKYRYGAFACPAGALERELRARDIAMVVIAGTLTNVCCESTAREANLRGYKVIFLSDATAAVTDAEHNAALLSLCIHFADVKDSAAFLAMLYPPAA